MIDTFPNPDSTLCFSINAVGNGVCFLQKLLNSFPEEPTREIGRTIEVYNLLRHWGLLLLNLPISWDKTHDAMATGKYIKAGFLIIL